ncbi:flavin reductase family protein [Kitasatospora sp. NPDC056184]|uniref:flavin reductase family protein n=1 Tax=Kitasatospora sp. NPDC056184 TaxID=3345738 RepID=UPI0035DBECAE
MDSPIGPGTRTAPRPPRAPSPAGRPPAPRFFAPDEREFRTTLGHFCTGVAVITAQDDEPLGFTCQSLTALSLTPPLVTFAAGNGSRSLPRIVRSGVFSANVLASDQEALGRRFGSGQQEERFSGVEWHPSPISGSPHLADALAWIDCRVHEALPGGDHTIVVGRVTGVAWGSGDPLLYFRSQFRHLAAPPNTATAPSAPAT